MPAGKRALAYQKANYDPLKIELDGKIWAYRGFIFRDEWKKANEN